MENVHWKTPSSQAKVMGTIVSSTGALVVTFYKGQPIILMSPNNRLFSSSQSNWILGGLFVAAESFSTSLWYIMQASTHKKKYPILFTVFFQCLFATIMSAVFALIAIKDATVWKLKLDAGLIAILYTGIVAIVVRYSLVTWCVWKAGALYCSMFEPLAIIFGVVMGVIFLGDPVYLGSLVGAVEIVGGFYGVMWGKAKEEKVVEDGEAIEAENKVPLIQDKSHLQKYNPM